MEDKLEIPKFSQNNNISVPKFYDRALGVDDNFMLLSPSKLKDKKVKKHGSIMAVTGMIAVAAFAGISSKYSEFTKNNFVVRAGDSFIQGEKSDSPNQDNVTRNSSFTMKDYLAGKDYIAYGLSDIALSNAAQNEEDIENFVNNNGALNISADKDFKSYFIDSTDIKKFNESNATRYTESLQKVDNFMQEKGIEDRTLSEVKTK